MITGSELNQIMVDTVLSKKTLLNLRDRLYFLIPMFLIIQLALHKENFSVHRYLLTVVTYCLLFYAVMNVIAWYRVIKKIRGK